MKVTLSKSVLQQMPEQVRSLVVAWQQRYHKRQISVVDAAKFSADEDSKVTMINLASGVSGSARVAGEFAGMTNLSPTAYIPLPVGCVAVETGFFCGTPFLTLWQGRSEHMIDVRAEAAILNEQEAAV